MIKYVHAIVSAIADVLGVPSRPIRVGHHYLENQAQLFNFDSSIDNMNQIS